MSSRSQVPRSKSARNLELATWNLELLFNPSVSGSESVSESIPTPIPIATPMGMPDFAAISVAFPR
jgi:hypothetical protein